eukprot:4425706-Pyramimonas_sp.AAC.1
MFEFASASALVQDYEEHSIKDASGLDGSAWGWTLSIIDQAHARMHACNGIANAGKAQTLSARAASGAPRARADWR